LYCVVTRWHVFLHRVSLSEISLHQILRNEIPVIVIYHVRHGVRVWFYDDGHAFEILTYLSLGTEATVMAATVMTVALGTALGLAALLQRGANGPLGAHTAVAPATVRAALFAFARGDTFQRTTASALLFANIHAGPVPLDVTAVQIPFADTVLTFASVTLGYPRRWQTSKLLLAEAVFIAHSP